MSDMTPAIYGLSYLDDAEREQMPHMLRPLEWATVRDDIRAWIKALA